MLKKADLTKAYGGSWYTIIGTGGDLDEWVEGYEGMLAEREIGKPQAWFTTTGAEINRLAEDGDPDRVADRDRFPEDLIFLMFPLEGLHVGKLALFKVVYQDRWFDDIIDNMRRYTF